VKNASVGFNREIYLKFDLTSLGTVSSARLRLFGADEPAGTARNQPVAVYGLANTSWSETTLTWNNRPLAGGAALATATILDTTPRWYEWDITSYVQQAKASGAATLSVV